MEDDGVHYEEAEQSEMEKQADRDDGPACLADACAGRCLHTGTGELAAECDDVAQHEERGGPARTDDGVVCGV